MELVPKYFEIFQKILNFYIKFYAQNTYILDLDSLVKSNMICSKF